MKNISDCANLWFIVFKQSDNGRMLSWSRTFAFGLSVIVGFSVVALYQVTMVASRVGTVGCNREKRAMSLPVIDCINLENKSDPH